MLKTATLRIFLIASVGVICARSLPAQNYYPDRPVDLSGMWFFELDRTDSGVDQKWFSRRLRGYLKLPGVLQAQNYGDEIGTNTPWVLSLYDRFWFLREDYKDYTEKNVRVPFLSQPPRHYVGVAWYQRAIQIPQNWVNRRVVLTLERPHWDTTVWIDNKLIGSNRSLVAPHIYDLGQVQAGQHQLTIRIDNRMLLPYRPDAHSVSDSLASSWNGIVGRIDLTSTGRIWIEDAQAFPNLAKKSVLVKVRVGNQTGLSGSGTVTVTGQELAVAPISWDDTGGTGEVEVPLRYDAPVWDEFNPKLLALRLWLKGNGVDEYSDLKFGLRDFHAQGKEFVLNDHPIIFRGTHSGGDFPLTGYPAMDVDSWKKIFETCRSWGLNHMRFHSWCPPEAAFQAADEVGFYLQPEPGMWNEISPDTPMERILYDETNRMIKAYGNHPSFMLLSPSNEPKGKWKEALARWVEVYRKIDPRRLYANGTGHTEREFTDFNEGTDYLAVQRIGPRMLRRESAWFGGDYGESLSDVTIPVISHEVGQWAAYPDYDIIKKFKGYMRPGNFEIFRDSMKEHNLLDLNRSFANASGKFQLECYKEEIEANLRTPGLSGFQLLDLHDYLGQGTALVGLLDAFWEPKSYVTADDFRKFCNTTVPLARLRQRVFTNDDRLEADVEVAHFGPAPLEKLVAVWRAGGKQGEWEIPELPIGKNIHLGKISVDLSTLKSPRDYQLSVTIAPAKFFTPIGREIIKSPEAILGKTYFVNDWNFWVYPSPNFEPPPPVTGPCPVTRNDLLITNSWDEALARLNVGGRVLFSPRNIDLDWMSPPLDTVPVFWNRQMSPGWSRMLGIWVQIDETKSKSGALMQSPTSDHFDWQWGQILPGSRAINLDRLPQALEPVVWAIDDWNRNYKLGVLFECAVGKGSLLVSAIDVTKTSVSNPVLRQLRRSLVDYGNSGCFNPMVGVSTEEMESLFFDTRIMSKLGARAEANGAPANQVIDSDPNTYVLVGDQKAATRDQVEIVIDFPKPVTMSGVVLMPRQNHREHEGEMHDVAIRISDDGLIWTDIARPTLVSSFEPKRITFSNPVTTRHLKLVSLTGFGTDKTTSLAEVAVIYTGPKLNDKGEPIEYQRNRSATPDIDEGPDRTKPSASPKTRP
jgi:beta-galactosidase